MFATFDERTQDFGNISYGVKIEGQRYFDHAGRFALPRNAVRLAELRAAWTDAN